GGGDPDAHHVHDRVRRVRRGKAHLAAHRRHPDAVAVPTDPGHDAAEQPPVPLLAQGTEHERVEERDRSGAHREDVAHDAPHAGGRPLVGLDRRRVRVGLHLEHHRQPVSDVDGARVLAWTDDHPRALGRKRPEVDLRALVGAVLRPHHAVHGELVVVRLPAEPRPDRLQLVVGETERPMQRLLHAGYTLARAYERNEASIGWPPVGPTSGSTACSGCGISPTTFPASLRPPAMAPRLPFTLCRSSTVPSGPQYRRTTSPSCSTRSRSSSAATNCPSPCLTGTGSTSPGTRPVVIGEREVSTRTWTNRQTKRSCRLRMSAPGSSPASHRIWKPLQMPRTGPPRSANRRTSSMTGANRAMAPVRR